MGCSVSCSTWVKFSSFIQWLAQTEAQTGLVMHYLDDYLFIGKKGSRDCRILLETFHLICQHLGVPIAHEKTEGPITKIVFLGLEIDSVNQTITIPLNKLKEIEEKIKAVLKKSKVTLK